ncbi:receptor-transporting protein 3-like [Brienomyrus brachyistius]|uniref:receptor-transporting protein 3-like n=1 Tax=Brienomyrus brachyistius TaxID=42636 RepID=UPI0020B34A82|nr:receptor-transporting protein 3-like [Brienomyrus brachyistius]
MTRDWTPALWSDTFAQLEEDELEHDDSWAFAFNYSLTETLTYAERRRGWKIYRHHAHGGFRCSTCSRQWSSARAVVLFRYRLQSSLCRGTIIMRPFGQACRHCGGDFERPGFSPKEVENVLLCLFDRIRKNCYGEREEGDEDLDSISPEKVWTKPHESTLCEACSQNICCQDK